MHACMPHAEPGRRYSRAGRRAVCMQCSTPHLCSLRILIYTVTNSYTQGSPRRDTDETQTRPRDAARRSRTTRLRTPSGRGARRGRAHTRPHTQSDTITKGGPQSNQENTTADASVVASPEPCVPAQGRIRTEGKRPKGSKQGRLTVRGNDRHRNWSLDAVLTWRAQRGKPTRRVQLSSHA